MSGDEEMKRSASDKERSLDRLLSGGGLSGPERDVVFGRVMDELGIPEDDGALERGGTKAAAKTAPPWASWLKWLSVPALAAAGVIFFLVPRDDGFSPRGNSQDTPEDLTFSCGVKAPCRAGEVLRFSLRVPQGGKVTGRATSPEGDTLVLCEDEPVDPGALLAYDVTLPASLSPGTYEVTFVSHDAAGGKARWTTSFSVAGPP